MKLEGSISPSNEHLGLISFRMDWLDLLADSDCKVPAELGQESQASSCVEE